MKPKILHIWPFPESLPNSALVLPASKYNRKEYSLRLWNHFFFKTGKVSLFKKEILTNLTFTESAFLCVAQTKRKVFSDLSSLGKCIFPHIHKCYAELILQTAKQHRLKAESTNTPPLVRKKFSENRISLKRAQTILF